MTTINKVSFIEREGGGGGRLQSQVFCSETNELLSKAKGKYELSEYDEGGTIHVEFSIDESKYSIRFSERRYNETRDYMLTVANRIRRAVEMKAESVKYRKKLAEWNNGVGRSTVISWEEVPENLIKMRAVAVRGDLMSFQGDVTQIDDNNRGWLGWTAGKQHLKMNEIPPEIRKQCLASKSERQIDGAPTAIFPTRSLALKCSKHVSTACWRHSSGI